jgi:NCAIR mutase (PurE)-related protein
VRSLSILVGLAACSSSNPDLLVVVAGARVILAGMVAELVEVK